ncbi:head GIN domain-containing protein [Siphonobacter aquaeclarae]|uniref:Putative auto-transporter adhesin, head GIN domain n=1 Tax=Siphonobacter aquaeclarae TaxID=563176 RepID=A0A1G9PY23_9BACT|nr:head GIN domain-containing protein [Siphonobacter aquaeclarae]SDM03644.1 Putative auto-transporter adhesin, head GIN domain [Siphonobacter aquaeclarae]
MKHFTFLLVLLGCSTTLFAQETRTFSLKNFDRFQLSSAFVVDVRPGDFSVKAEGEAKDLDDLVAEVRNGELDIHFKEKDKGWWKNNRRERVTITLRMPALKGIQLSGATKSDIAGFSSDKLDIRISGASNAKIDVKAKQVALDLSGASSINLTGSAGEIKGSVSGATSFQGGDFAVDRAVIDASGASSAHVNVKESLSAQASGASKIRYRGHPSVQANTSGASSVRSE